MKARKSKTFRRMLLSYLLVVMLPCCILFAMLYRFGIRDVQGQVEAMYNASLEQAKTQFELRMAECRDAGIQISNDFLISFLQTSQYEHHAKLEGIGNLKRYETSNQFLDSIIVKNYADGAVYTSRGTVNIDVLLSNIYGFSAEGIIAFEYALDTASQIEYVNFPSERVIAHLVPLPTSRVGRPQGVAAFVIREASMRGVFSSIIGLGESKLLMLNENDSILFSMASDGKLLGREEEAVFLANWLQGKAVVELDGKKYYVFSAYSDLLDWHIVSLIDQQLLFRDMFAQRTLIILANALLMLCAIIMAYWMANRSYRPIRMLTNLALRDKNQDTRPKGDDFENIRYALDISAEERKMLSEKLDMQRQVLQQSIVLHLLSGDDNAKDNLADACAQLGMFLSNMQVFVCAIRFLDLPEESLLSTAPIMESIARQYAGQSVYCVERSEAVEVVMIVGLTLHEDRCGWMDAFLAAVPEVDSKWCRVGVGRCYERLNDIHLSYMESYAAIDGESENRSYILFEDVLPHQPGEEAEQENAIIYTQAVRQANETQALISLNALLDTMQKRHTNNHNWMPACTVIADKVLAIAYEEATSEKEDDEEIARIANQLYASESFGAFRHWINELTRAVCGLLTVSRLRVESNTRETIESFMQSNYRNPDMSLNMLSSRFGYSIGYWSRFFQDTVGTGFSEYLWALRFQKAKELFVTTKKPIREIVEEIGYMDTSSFIRRFKKEMGITPGQFRESQSE